MRQMRSIPGKGTSGVAIVGIVIGVLYFVFGLFRHQVVFGSIGLLIMLTYVGLLYGLRGRFEPAELLSGNPGDERQVQVVLRASALTGQLLICAVTAGLLVSLAAGSHYVIVFGTLSALGGASFIVATAWYSRKV